MVVSGRREGRLEQIVSEHPGIESVVLDVTDPAAVQDVTAQRLRRFPDLDVLVTVAGVMLPEDLHHADFLAVAEATVATNLLGAIRTEPARCGQSFASTRTTARSGTRGSDRRPFQGDVGQIVGDLMAYDGIGLDELLVDLSWAARDAQELKDVNDEVYTAARAASF
ncbi:SDR family NAD(P)-dependent oxidoreductase [Streptomyces sp. cg40]|uniref:SDR family NAD(P)-dependent oxidoreductase n=1 Tax=Streptomyces sp. cg40 TaxID=3419764 RepID=UPI003D03B23E